MRKTPPFAGATGKTASEKWARKDSWTYVEKWEKRKRNIAGLCVIGVLLVPFIRWVILLIIYALTS